MVNSQDLAPLNELLAGDGGQIVYRGDAWHRTEWRIFGLPCADPEVAVHRWDIVIESDLYIITLTELGDGWTEKTAVPAGPFRTLEGAVRACVEQDAAPYTLFQQGDNAQ